MVQFPQQYLIECKKIKRIENQRIYESVHYMNETEYYVHHMYPRWVCNNENIFPDIYDNLILVTFEEHQYLHQLLGYEIDKSGWKYDVRHNYNLLLKHNLNFNIPTIKSSDLKSYNLPNLSLIFHITNLMRNLVFKQRMLLVPREFNIRVSNNNIAEYETPNSKWRLQFNHMRVKVSNRISNEDIYNLVDANVLIPYDEIRYYVNTRPFLSLMRNLEVKRLYS